MGEGWKLTESGATGPDGKLPVNMSSGVLSYNPIGASGMIRFDVGGRHRQAVGGAAAPSRPSRSPTTHPELGKIVLVKTVTIVPGTDGFRWTNPQFLPGIVAAPRGGGDE